MPSATNLDHSPGASSERKPRGSTPYANMDQNGHLRPVQPSRSKNRSSSTSSAYSSSCERDGQTEEDGRKPKDGTTLASQAAKHVIENGATSVTPQTDVEKSNDDAQNENSTTAHNKEVIREPTSRELGSNTTAEDASKPLQSQKRQDDNTADSNAQQTPRQPLEDDRGRPERRECANRKQTRRGREKRYQSYSTSWPKPAFGQQDPRPQSARYVAQWYENNQWDPPYSNQQFQNASNWPPNDRYSDHLSKYDFPPLSRQHKRPGYLPNNLRSPSSSSRASSDSEYSDIAMNRNASQRDRSRRDQFHRRRQSVAGSSDMNRHNSRFEGSTPNMNQPPNRSRQMFNDNRKNNRSSNRFNNRPHRGRGHSMSSFTHFNHPPPFSPLNNQHQIQPPPHYPSHTNFYGYLSGSQVHDTRNSTGTNDINGNACLQTPRMRALSANDSHRVQTNRDQWYPPSNGNAHNSGVNGDIYNNTQRLQNAASNCGQVPIGNQIPLFVHLPNASRIPIPNHQISNHSSVYSVDQNILGTLPYVTGQNSHQNLNTQNNPPGHNMHRRFSEIGVVDHQTFQTSQMATPQSQNASRTSAPNSNNFDTSTPTEHQSYTSINIQCRRQTRRSRSLDRETVTTEFQNKSLQLEIEEEMERANGLLPMRQSKNSGSNLDPGAVAFTPSENQEPTHTVVQGNGKSHIMVRSRGMSYFRPSPSLSTDPNETSDFLTVDTNTDSPNCTPNSIVPLDLDRSLANQAQSESVNDHSFTPTQEPLIISHNSLLASEQLQSTAALDTSQVQSFVTSQGLTFTAYNPVVGASYTQTMAPIPSTNINSIMDPSSSTMQAPLVQHPIPGIQQPPPTVIYQTALAQSGIAPNSGGILMPAMPHIDAFQQINSPVHNATFQMPVPQSIPLIVQPTHQISTQTIGQPMNSYPNVQPVQVHPQEPMNMYNTMLVSNIPSQNRQMPNAPNLNFFPHVFPVLNDQRPPRLDPKPITIDANNMLPSKDKSSLIERVEGALKEVQHSLRGSKQQKDKEESWRGIVMKVMKMPSEFFAVKPDDHPELKQLREVGQVIGSLIKEVKNNLKSDVSETELVNEVMNITSSVLTANLNKSTLPSDPHSFNDSAVMQFGPVTGVVDHAMTLSESNHQSLIPPSTTLRLTEAIREFARICEVSAPSPLPEDEGIFSSSEAPSSPRFSAQNSEIREHVSSDGSEEAPTETASEGSNLHDQIDLEGALGNDETETFHERAEDTEVLCSPNVSRITSEQRETDRRRSMGKVNIGNLISSFENKGRTKSPDKDV